VDLSYLEVFSFVFRFCQIEYPSLACEVESFVGFSRCMPLSCDFLEKSLSILVILVIQPRAIFSNRIIFFSFSFATDSSIYNLHIRCRLEFDRIHLPLFARDKNGSCMAFVPNLLVVFSVSNWEALLLRQLLRCKFLVWFLIYS
jgi:hypothetical protein